MKIFVDADACPVKETILRLAHEYGVKVVFVVSTAGYFDRGWRVEKILVDSLPQAVDIAIINRVEAGDVVVTQDYGLASLVLGKQAKAISPRGRVFHEQNIDRLLQQRQMGFEARKAGIRSKGPRERLKKDDRRFAEIFKESWNEFYEPFCLQTTHKHRHSCV